MKQLFFALCLTFLLNSVLAQQADSIVCPKIEIEGPYDNRIAAGKEAVLIVNKFKKSYEKSHSLTYSWIVNTGSIIGNTTGRSIHIDTKGLLGQAITATLIISGLETNCPSTKSITIEVVPAQFKTEQKVISRPARF